LGASSFGAFGIAGAAMGGGVNTGSGGAAGGGTVGSFGKEKDADAGFCPSAFAGGCAASLRIADMIRVYAPGPLGIGGSLIIGCAVGT